MWLHNAHIFMAYRVKKIKGFVIAHKMAWPPNQVFFCKRQDNEFGGSGSRATVAQQQQQQQEAAQAGGGVYYVLLPDGRLQRVAYSTSRDNQQFQKLIAAPEPVNAGFLAIQYQDVQPIQAPVYSYGSPLVRLFKK